METENATILLHRRANVVQPVLVYRVEIDEHLEARHAVSQRPAAMVPAGQHKVKARVMCWSSLAQPVNVAPGETVTVDIGPDVRHLWNMFVKPYRFIKVNVAPSD
jgi:hypothetical protein